MPPSTRSLRHVSTILALAAAFTTTFAAAVAPASAHAQATANGQRVDAEYTAKIKE